MLGHNDDYEQARRKLRKAEENEKVLSTDPDEGKVHGKRKRREFRKRKFRNEFSNTEQEISSDNLSYPEFPECDENEARNEPSPSVFKLSSKNKSLEECSSSHKFTHFSCDQSLSPPKTFGSIRDVYSIAPEDTTDTHYRPPDNTPRDNDVISILNRMTESQNKFREEVFRRLNIIHLKVLDLEKIVKNNNNGGNSIKNVPVHSEVLQILRLFPLDQEKLRKVENTLSSDNDDEDIRNCLAKELSRVGGTDTAEIVKRLMYKMFTNELGHEYSWDGAKGKKKFKNLKIAVVIFDAVRLNKESTDSDIIIFIKKWLVRAKDRIKSAEAKKSRLMEENS